ncbi:MAG: hypothetical protein B6I20_05805 [Bacteroidetes bacterium 4572_117]|nr:MAG: hypothetical protein B6I20_05805 [Bacteroidetes bacterium 4572_117]
MKNLKLKIVVISLFIFQSLVMVRVFFILKTLLLNSENFSLSQYNLMFLIAAFLIWAIVSVVFVVLIFRVLSKKEKIIIQAPIKDVVDKKSEKKRRNEEEQRKLSEIEKKRNKIVNSLMDGLTNIGEEKKYCEKLLSNLAKHYEIVQGIIFIKDENDSFRKSATYAYYSENEVNEFIEGVGIAGQVAKNKALINISNLPENYLTILSGLGSSAPANLVIFPILAENKTVGVVELATFVKIDKLAEQVLTVLSRMLGEQIQKLS